jgi:hypothetical protein
MNSDSGRCIIGTAKVAPLRPQTSGAVRFGPWLEVTTLFKSWQADRLKAEMGNRKSGIGAFAALNG